MSDWKAKHIKHLPQDMVKYLSCGVFLIIYFQRYLPFMVGLIEYMPLYKIRYDFTHASITPNGSLFFFLWPAYIENCLPVPANWPQ